MQLRSLSYRTQIFLSSLILVILPISILSITTANNTARRVSAEYQTTLDTITNQASLTFDTLLNDAEKVSSLYLFNDETYRILNRNYQDDLILLSQDSVKLQSQISQANSFKTNVVSCIIENKYGYTFTYNILNSKAEAEIMAHMSTWSELARQNEHHKYFGPIQHLKYTGNIYKNILPMVKILIDPYTNAEIGVFYISINFDTIQKAVDASQLTNSTILLFNNDNELVFSSDPAFTQERDKESLLRELTAVSAALSPEQPSQSLSLKLNPDTYSVSAAYNQTTGWKIIHFMDNQTVTLAYQANLGSYLLILAFTVVLSFAFAYLLSRSLTTPIKQLCQEVDSWEAGNLSSIQLNSHLSSKELQRLADSYNSLILRLTDSLTQNYTILLNEKQMRLKMLKSQINHHFLYNTLNVISSLANIHNIPEIRTISNSMSEILRYNLQSGTMVQVADELNQISKYIAIQHLRFPDKFDYVCEADDRLLSHMIPAFILQPIIENCFHHGFLEKEAECCIAVQVFEADSCLHVRTTDNGSGIETGKLDYIKQTLARENQPKLDTDSSGSIGIINVHQRIRTYFGSDYGISIESQEGIGTKIDIRMPLDKPFFEFIGRHFL